MKHKFITAAITALLLLCLCCGSAAAMTGSGTAADPYILSSKADLDLLSGNRYASYVGNDKYFELGTNITMLESFTPIGSTIYRFNGHFDGKGHNITGMNISANGYAGLFSYVSSGAYMANINFYNANINSTGIYAGVLYGYGVNTSTGQITVKDVNVYDSVVYSNSSICGGISGYAASSGDVDFTSCNVERCLIKSSNNYCVGGIFGAGGTGNGEFTFCSVKDCIIQSYTSSCGGICGASSGYGGTTIIQGCIVENCYIMTRSTAGGISANPIEISSGVSCTIIDCSVLRSTIVGTNGTVGGIYGTTYNENQLLVTGCEVTDCTLISGDGAGGVAASKKS